MADVGTAPFNNPRAEPKLEDLLAMHKRDIMLSLNCHAIATIQSFDSSKQTVSATLNYKKTLNRRNPSTGVYENVLEDYPILLDCPAIVLRGGMAALTLPITAGDSCVILFNDRDIDNWFKSGQASGCATPRAHSFSDGIALIGMASLQNPIANYDATRATLRNGDASVGVGSAKIRLKNNDTTLNTLLQDLVNAIKAITTTNAVVGAPCAVSATSQTALANIATQIGGLLE